MSRLDGVKDAAVQKCRAWHSDSHESPPPIHHETICRSGGQMPHIRRTCLAFHSWKLDFSHGRTRRICKICGRWDFQIRPCPAQFGRDFMVCRVRRILHRIYGAARNIQFCCYLSNAHAPFSQTGSHHPDFSHPLYPSGNFGYLSGPCLRHEFVPRWKFLRAAVGFGVIPLP